MTIAVLCNYELQPNRIGGMDYFFWRFDSAVKNLGHQIEWFFPNHELHGDYPNMIIFAAERNSIENMFIEVIASKKKHYDIIFCHFLELCTPFYKKLKSQLPLSRVIVIDHNPRPFEGYPFKKKLLKRIKGLMFSKYIDQFVGVSEYTVAEISKDFGRHLNSKTEIIYNGILTEKIRIKRERNHHNPRFLTACHLRRSKGIQDLIEAVYLLPKEIQRNLVIDIYGDGEYKDDLQKLIIKLGLEFNFIFKGNSPNLGGVFYNYDYLIQPTHMECFSLSILEGLAANVPVITTPVGGNLEVVTNNYNGFVFNAGDCTALKSILENIILGKMKITQNTSIQIQEGFTLAKMVENYLKLIH
jgi:glycosyltransferase involved in cell wall biosynthesis